MADAKFGALEVGHYVEAVREERNGFKCSPRKVCCKTRRGQLTGLASCSCALIFIVLLAIPGGIIQFVEPSFGEVTDVSGVTLTSGVGTLDVAGTVKVQIVNENIFPINIRDIDVFLSKGTIKIDLSPPQTINIAGQSTFQFDVGLSATFNGVDDASTIGLITTECVLGSSEFDLLGSIVASYHVVTQQKDFAGIKLDLGC